MKDYYGKDASCLKNKKLFLFDMDGTIYLGDRLFDGVPELLAQFEKNGGRYVFITNNPTKSSRDYRLKLEKMGITDLTDDNFYTSVQASIALFLEKFGNKLKIMFILKSLLMKRVSMLLILQLLKMIIHLGLKVLNKKKLRASLVHMKSMNLKLIQTEKIMLLKN